MQLLYLRVTSPRKDERAFAAWKQGQIESIANRKLSPETVFYDEMTAVRTGNHPRRQPATIEMLDKVDPDRAIAVVKDRFSDMGSFTFVFVGNIDLAKLQPLVEQYIATLPATGRKEKWRDINVKHPTQKIEKTILAGTEPKSTYLEKVREKIKRAHETELKENWWWMFKLREVYYFNEEFTNATDLEPLFKRATSANVKAAAAKHFTPNSYVLGVMRPKT